MTNQLIEDYNTCKIIHCIFDELKTTFEKMEDENFDLYKSYENWQKYTYKFYKNNNYEIYRYLFSSVLSNKNFCINFTKFMSMNSQQLENMMKTTKTFYRNSYILFLLQIKFA